jgi:hypothetical protein
MQVTLSACHLSAWEADGGSMGLWETILIAICQPTVETEVLKKRSFH